MAITATATPSVLARIHVRPSWSALAEYQYYNFGKSNFTTPAALVPFGSFTTDDHVLKAGVNYRFNWGARSPPATDRQQILKFSKGGHCAGPFCVRSHENRQIARSSQFY